jgi:hypothetical protein
VPKRVCSSRAEWRLQPGKPAEALSPHYRLDCDYGTGVITCWEDGGSEPIYVCGSHAKQLGRPRKAVVTDIRIIATPSDASGNSIKIEERAEIQEVDAPEPPPKISAPTPQVADAPPETSPSLSTDVPAATPQAAACDSPIEVAAKAVERIEIPEAAAPPPKISAAPEPARSAPEPKVARAAEPPARPPARDLAYGNPAKAMVDEAIWNLATGNYQAYKAALQQGKSATDAAEAAGGQLAMVHRKIGDYSRKLENLLSESKATIHVAEAIDKPLEHAVLEVIGNGAMSDSEKDAAIHQLGTLQEWVKHGLHGNITPLDANRILLAIGDRLNWGGAAEVAEQFKPVYRTLYANLKAAIRAAVPEAQNLHDRLTNLYAAKSDLEVR